MPGLYGITTRAPGTLISGLIYNGDHQNHVDGRAALFVQAHGISTGQLGIQYSPFGPDGVTESLPISFSDELTRLRFVIAAVKTFLNGGTSVVWWAPVTSPAYAGVGARVQRTTAQLVNNAALTTIDFTGATIEFNTNTIWSGANPTRFTAPFTGLYYCAASVDWDGSTTGGGVRQLQIGLNGAFGASGDQAKNNTTVTGAIRSQRQTITGLRKLTAGDFIEYAAFQNSGASLNLITNLSLSIVGSLVYFGAA